MIIGNHHPTALEPISTRLFFYSIAWSVLTLSKWVIVFPETQLGVFLLSFGVTAVAIYWPHRFWVTPPRTTNKNCLLNTGSCWLNAKPIDHAPKKFCQDPNTAFGESLLLKPRLNRFYAALFAFCFLILLSIFLFLLNTKMEFSVTSVIIIALATDTLITFVWYCTDWADSFALVSANVQGLQVGSVWRPTSAEYKWDSIFVDAFSVGSSLVRLTFHMKNKCITLIVNESVFSNIIVFIKNHHDLPANSISAAPTSCE